MQLVLVIFLLGAASFLALHRRLRQGRLNLPLPPGPRGLPFVGNIREMSNATEPPWEMYHRWSQIYGDVLHHTVYGHHTVVLNSQKSIVELLDKRSHNYSDRPGECVDVSVDGRCSLYWAIDMPMLNDLMGYVYCFDV